LVGGMVGDAAGAVLEFRRYYDEDHVRVAMTMPGGGLLAVGPGQITDDSELMLALLHGLRGSHPSAFPAEAVAQRYIDWLQSRPFDMGNTTRLAFSARSPSEVPVLAAQLNTGSEANGALMRAAPIALWCVKHNMPYTTVAAHARADSRLSHSSKVCQDANAVFCVALAHLLQHLGDYKGAIQQAEMLISTDDVHPTVAAWMEDSKSMAISSRKCVPNIGHAKHAFTLAMHLLRNSNDYSYEDAIFKVLTLGGDTDTNACICGYVMGALRGLDGIPEYMRRPVLEFDSSKIPPGGQGHLRPDTYKAIHAMDLL